MSRPNPNSHKKKVVIVIVEGPSDKLLLEVSLSEFFEKKYGENTVVKFAMFERDDGYYGTDITSLYGSTPEKIEMLMNKKILIPALEGLPQPAKLQWKYKVVQKRREKHFKTNEL